MDKEIIEIVPENFSEEEIRDALEVKAISDFLNGVSSKGIDAIIGREVKRLISEENKGLPAK